MDLKNLELRYFPIRGRGEIIRLILYSQGIEFNDKIIGFEEWKEAEKTKQPCFQRLPILICGNGFELSESGSISRFLSSQLNLLGNSAEDRAHLESLLDVYFEILNRVYMFLYQKPKEKVTSEALLNCVSPLLSLLEKKIKGEWSFGDSMTVPDLGIYDLVANYLLPLDLDVEKEFPSCYQISKKISSLPTISNYMKEKKMNKCSLPGSERNCGFVFHVLCEEEGGQKYNCFE